MNKSKAVEEYLRTNGSITTWEAIQNFKATRLSAIIFNLKPKLEAEGLKIVNQDIYEEDGIRYTRYMLVDTKKYVQQMVDENENHISF